MRFEITANVINSSGASRVLSSSELASLTDGTTSSGLVSISAGETLSVVCDLGNRYNLDTLRYYYSGLGSVSVYLAEAEDNWISSACATISGGVELGVSSYYPRWFKIDHEVSSGYDESYEVEVYSDNQNILFGTLGQFDSYGVDASGVEVDSISIYNSTASVRNINVFIGDDSDINAESAICLGLTSSGLYYSKRSASVSFPDNFSWDNGQHENTIVSGTNLTLSGTATSGTYYSPVFYFGNYDNSRFFWDSYEPVGSFIKYIGVDSSESCFGVRRYGVPPSGSWYSGSLAETYDSLWSLSEGSLEFVPIPNNTILERRDHYYMQFCTTISGNHPSPPYIAQAGIEGALVVSGVSPSGYRDIYMASSSGTTSGGVANLLCWYEG